MNEPVPWFVVAGSLIGAAILVAGHLGAFG